MLAAVAFEPVELAVAPHAAQMDDVPVVTTLAELALILILPDPTEWARHGYPAAREGQPARNTRCTEIYTGAHSKLAFAKGRPGGQRRNVEPINAATANGALSAAERIMVSGHSPPISPLRSIIVVTWLGTMRVVHSQFCRRDANPMADDATKAPGMPMVQYCALSHASRRPLNACIPSSRVTPVRTLTATVAHLGSMAALSAERRRCDKPAVA